MKIKLIFWNVEGLKSALQLANNELLYAQDILIFAETLTVEPLDIPGFYGEHVPATQGLRGRPMRGISCYYKSSMGKIRRIHRDEDALIIESELLTLVSLYIEPLTPIEDIITTISTLMAQISQTSNIIVAGDFNCRIDLQNHRSQELLQMMTRRF